VNTRDWTGALHNLGVDLPFGQDVAPEGALAGVEFGRTYDSNRAYQVVSPRTLRCTQVAPPFHGPDGMVVSGQCEMKTCQTLSSSTLSKPSDHVVWMFSVESLSRCVRLACVAAVTVGLVLRYQTLDGLRSSGYGAIH
jgi:hypothetical protein